MVGGVEGGTGPDGIPGRRGLVGVVVTLLVILIVAASRAAAKAEAIVLALEDSRVNTRSLADLDTTNSVAMRIVEAAIAARTHLAGRRSHR